jgi:hypothetical protein
VNSPLAGRCIRIFRHWLLLLNFPLVAAVSLAADSTATSDYSFDTTSLAVKPVDASASIEFYPYLLLYNKASPLYSLKFGSGNRTYADIYNLKTEGYFHYQRKPFLGFVSGALYGAYLRQDDSLSYDAKIFEGYLKYTPDASLSFLVGKRLFQWGKGYSYNPVSFAGRMKDLNDIDATLEGFWNISAEYVKSFNSPISSVALSAVFLPVYNVINKDYLPDKSVAGLAQLYMLAANTDIDIYFFADNRHDLKAGLDFSRNVIPDLEVHGEWVFLNSLNSTVFSDESTTVELSRPANNCVAGTRYLAPFNTTFILEYLHIGSGYTRDEMDGYWNAVNYATYSSNPQRIQSVLQANSTYFNSQFITTDYIFFKASHPDPFNFVYFTPSIYTIVNILDRSMMAGLEMTYSRSRNLLFTGRYITFLGKNESEYGQKPAQHRIELRAKWSF